ncbi:MAG: M23 family metallopeptidase [Clostridia bacterium]|nr:M23 family metallopeptidase [Clostridia bacterium]
MKNKYTIFILLFTLILSLFSTSTNNKLFFPINNKKYIITSKYGYRTLNYYHFHNGIDIALSEGTKLYAMSDGVVSFIGYSKGYGNNIIITYSNGYKSMYAHISSNFIVKKGQNVKAKELVAFVGPKYLKSGKLNGMTTGPHLHFTIYKNNKSIDPLSIKYST